uniref:AlNc14C554G12140 protein n=1 Tax=Albugo laibachii Nc14 TaxID=890382 RepID=F0X147_9STRA|nr:AlNc14C554G12140 [Albugo laibachii Nc14]|eukprot:CCA27502.1 AlNc14C554G12140 [Albugo laibachii Nc14]
MVLNLAGTTDVIPQKSAASLHVTPGKMAEHLIWDCLIARTVWTTAARPLEKTFPSPYRWSTTVDWTELVLNAYACKQFGTHSIVRLLNVIRCAVLNPSGRREVQPFCYDTPVIPAYGFHGWFWLDIFRTIFYREFLESVS